MSKREKVILAVVLVVTAVAVYIDHQNTQECLKRGGAEGL
jgi:hypothetical protein